MSRGRGAGQRPEGDFREMAPKNGLPRAGLVETEAFRADKGAEIGPFG